MFLNQQAEFLLAEIDRQFKEQKKQNEMPERLLEAIERNE